MEAESKKSKRHRMLKNIAQKHPGFIQREKDELDRRKFSYNLDFQALKQKK
jgi:predicted transcriptional regulator